MTTHTTQERAKLKELRKQVATQPPVESYDFRQWQQQKLNAKLEPVAKTAKATLAKKLITKHDLGMHLHTKGVKLTDNEFIILFEMCNG